MRRVGHKGADLIAPGNTVASFEAALAAEVDMIEFDVLPEHADGTGELFLAHDYADLRRRRAQALTLADGIALFRGEAYAGVELDVDLKLPGYEDRVVGALRDAGLVERVLISTMEEVSLRHIRATAPEVKLGWSERLKVEHAGASGDPPDVHLAIPKAERLSRLRALAARVLGPQPDPVADGFENGGE